MRTLAFCLAVFSLSCSNQEVATEALVVPDVEAVIATVETPVVANDCWGATADRSLAPAAGTSGTHRA